MREIAAQILGSNAANDIGADEETKSVFGPRQMTDRLEGTWGLDEEGEVRACMWKRQQTLDNFWAMGGHTWTAPPMALAHPRASGQGGSGGYPTSSLLGHADVSGRLARDAL